MKEHEINNISEPTSEEEYIINYLDNSGIYFEREVKISNLKNDSKSYRIADFYLEDYEVYVEYFGMYNSSKEVRREYDQKAKIYISNHIPTIFLYPHELGFLEYAFHKKMLKVLKAFNFRKELKRYKIDRLKNKMDTNVGWIIGGLLCSGLLILMYFYETGLNEDFQFAISILLVIFGISPIWRYIFGYFKYFRYEE